MDEVRVHLRCERDPEETQEERLDRLLRRIVRPETIVKRGGVPDFPTINEAIDAAIEFGRDY